MYIQKTLPPTLDKVKIARKINDLSYKVHCNALDIMSMKFGIPMLTAPKTKTGTPNSTSIRLPAQIAGLHVQIRVLSFFGKCHCISYEFNAGEANPQKLQKLQDVVFEWLKPDVWAVDEFIDIDGNQALGMQAIDGGDYESVVRFGRFQKFEIAQDFPELAKSPPMVHITGTSKSRKFAESHYSGSLSSPKLVIGYDKSKERFDKGLEPTIYPHTYRVEVRIKPPTHMSKPDDSLVDGDAMTISGVAGMTKPFENVRLYDMKKFRMLKVSNPKARKQFANLADNRGVAHALNVLGGIPGHYTKKNYRNLLKKSEVDFVWGQLPDVWPSIVLNSLCNASYLELLLEEPPSP